MTSIDLVRSLRSYHFPDRLEVGDCISVTILIGAILQSQYSKSVEVVNGRLNNCYHTWLCVDGERIDPCLDCTLEPDFVDAVGAATTESYTIIDKIELNINDYCPGMTLQEIIKTFSHREIIHEQHTT